VTWNALKPREKTLIRYLIVAVAVGLLLLSVRSLGAPAVAAVASNPGPKPAGAVESEEAALSAGLARILSQVAGAGTVHVQVALRATEQQVYAVDHTTSTTAQQGAPAQTQSQASEQTVVVGNAALPVQVDGADVASVLVVASGASDPAVAAALTTAAAAALGVPIYEVAVLTGS
jgi:stage III sporulation protein AG